MSYKDRLRTMTYISPSGQEFTLQFDELSRSGGKKAPVSEFPGQDQGAVQDLGEQTITFPITAYITGADYDSEADRLWDALAETGPAKLVHPRWGNLNVLPSTREQREQFIDGAGRALFTIEFIKVNDDAFEYPRAEAAPDEQISAEVDAAGVAIGESVPDEIDDPREKAGLKENILDGLDKIKSGFRSVTGAVDGLQADINSAIFAIESNIDALVAAPADLMQSLLSLYRLPGRTAADVRAKIDGYTTIYNDLIDGFIETTTEYGENLGLINTAQLDAIQAAAAESTLDGLILTRDEIARILDNLRDLNGSIDSSIESLETAGSFQADYSSRAAADAAATRAITSLVDRALYLPAEQIITLGEDKTVLQLTFELYGDLERLDQLITYNGFGGDELLLIPAGTEVAYYE